MDKTLKSVIVGGICLVLWIVFKEIIGFELIVLSALAAIIGNQAGNQ